MLKAHTQVSEEMTITLPWPPAILGHNGKGRTHWRSKQPAKLAYKEQCYLIALANKPILPDGNIHLTAIFHPPTNHGHDLDNLLSKIKYGLDSVAKAWGINDKLFRPITIDFGNVIKGGKVVLTIGRNHEN